LDTFDYQGASGTLSFADGETSKAFPVPIVLDAQTEPNEIVNLTLSNPGGGASLGAQNTAVLTIVNNDILIYGNLIFSSTNYSVAENGINATIVVQRIGGTNGTISVDYTTTTNGTATPNYHYTPVANTLFWGSGDNTNKTFVVPILDNPFVDGNKTVGLALLNAV